MKTLNLADYLSKHPGWSTERIRRALWRHGVTTQDINAARNGFPKISTQPSARPMGQPLANLINQFDDVGKVEKAMRLLAKDSYVEDDEMRRSLSIGPDRWKVVCQHPNVAQYRFSLPRGNKHVWMHQSAQAKLTSAINIDHA